jgi:hypothetical protein
VSISTRNREIAFRVTGLALPAAGAAGAVCFVLFFAGSSWWPQALVWPGAVVGLFVVGYLHDAFDLRTPLMAAGAGFVGFAIPVTVARPSWWWVWIPVLLLTLALVGFLLALSEWSSRGRR